jgi:hypothetical protein
MDRRRALVVAGTLAGTLALAAGAMAVNLGLLSADRDPVGDLTPTQVQPAAVDGATPSTIVQDGVLRPASPPASWSDDHGDDDDHGDEVDDGRDGDLDDD